MTLTTLRRLVMSGAALSLAAAGAAAWFAVSAEASARPDTEWQKIFPVKSAGGNSLGTQLPGPLPEYQGPAGWPQGDKPVVEEKTDQPAVKPPDPFESKYRLNGVFVGSRGTDSHAQIAAAGEPLAFSILVGERIPEKPMEPKDPALTPWRLDAVRLPSDGSPQEAVFRHVGTGEEKVLKVAATASAGLAEMGGGGSTGEGGPDGGLGVGEARRQPPRARLVRQDPAKGEYEWEVADPEEWFGGYSEEQASTIATLPSKDAEGNPNGFVVKGIQEGNRAREFGFAEEDRVVSVNKEPVNSLEDAISKGKRQYDGGASSFLVKVIRSGKEVNYTFHAAKKKRTRVAE